MEENKTTSFKENTTNPTEKPLDADQPVLPKHKKGKLPLIIGVSILAMVILVVAILLDLHFNQPQDKQSEAANCVPDANMVNPCRPWVGAAAYGNPGTTSLTNKVVQFDYLESLLGHQLDVFRNYQGLPLTQDELHYINRPNTYIDLAWKPAGSFKAAMPVNQGGDPAVNARIAEDAKSVAAVAPHKIFISVWHEPQNDVSAFDSTPQGQAEAKACNSDPHFRGFVGSAGTPSQYIAMWQNVENIFRANGATNVVWWMVYQGTPVFRCMIPALYPGDNLVNWVGYDSYDHDDRAGTTFADTAGAVYNTLQADSGTSTNALGQPMNILDKPWGMSEFGTCKNINPNNTMEYYSGVPDSAGHITPVSTSALYSFQHNLYPRLKMYLVFADTGNQSGYSCLTDYDANPTDSASNSGNYDPAKQKAVNAFFTAILNSSSPPPGGTPTPTPVPVRNPTPTPMPTQKPTSSAPTPIASNIITNGSFENTGTSWLDPWRLNVHQGANGTVSQSTVSENGTYSAKITVLQTNALAYYVQLNQQNLTLKVGRTYTISFWAKAAANRPLVYSLVQSNSPFTLYLNNTVSLTTTWQHFTAEYTQSVTDTNVGLYFRAANASPDVFIDNVSIK